MWLKKLNPLFHLFLINLVASGLFFNFSIAGPSKNCRYFLTRHLPSEGTHYMTGMVVKLKNLKPVFLFGTIFDGHINLLNEAKKQYGDVKAITWVGEMEAINGKLTRAISTAGIMNPKSNEYSISSLQLEEKYSDPEILKIFFNDHWELKSIANERSQFIAYDNSRDGKLQHLQPDLPSMKQFRHGALGLYNNAVSNFTQSKQNSNWGSDIANFCAIEINNDLSLLKKYKFSSEHTQSEIETLTKRSLNFVKYQYTKNEFSIFSIEYRSIAQNINSTQLEIFEQTASHFNSPHWDQLSLETKVKDLAHLKFLADMINLGTNQIGSVLLEESIP